MLYKNWERIQARADKKVEILSLELLCKYKRRIYE